MAEHDEHDQHGGAPAAGGDPAGGHGGKGGKPAKGAGRLLSGPHGTEIMVICSVVLVGFGYLSIRRTKPTAAATSPAAAAGLAGSGSVAGFDQNAYLGLQTALANQSDQLAALLSSAQAGSGVPSGLPDGTTPATSPSLPSPLASPPTSYLPQSGPTAGQSHIGQTLANVTGSASTWTPSTSAMIGNGFTGGTVTGGGSSNGVYQQIATGPNTYGLMTGLPSTGSDGPIGSIISDGMGGWQKVTGYSFTGGAAHVASTKDGFTIGPNGQPIAGTQPSGGPVAAGSIYDNWLAQGGHYSETNIPSDYNKYDPRTNTIVNPWPGS